jgi:DNA-binding response OmpR family regulator
LSSDRDRAKVRVLVAEDDDMLLGLIERHLLGRGYEVMISRDGRDAMERLTKELVDVLLTDIGMPGLGGMALIRWSRANRPTVRIVAMTGLGTPELITACLELGASRCLTKPFRMENLERAIAQVAAEGPGS